MDGKQLLLNIESWHNLFMKKISHQCSFIYYNQHIRKLLSILCIVSVLTPTACFNIDHPIQVPSSKAITILANNVDEKKSSLPIGIPDPGFGLTDVMPDRPSNWNNEVAGYYFVNNDTGSDSNNAFGTPATPRATIPYPVPAGSYVEIEGNYNSTNGGIIRIRSSGTNGTWVANTAGPVWVVAAKTGKSHAFVDYKVVAYGNYLYLDGLTFKSGGRAYVGSSSSGFAADHIVIRNCDIQGQTSDHGTTLLGVRGASASSKAQYVVLFNNVAHDTGNLASSSDEDSHLYSFQGYTDNIWLLNNVGHTSSGSGLQVNHGGPNSASYNIYAGFNEFYDVRQSGMWVKHGTNVIFSQNHIHDVINTSWSPSKGMGAQKQPNGFWMLYNRIENTRYGIRIVSTSGTGPYNVYAIGNIIENIGWESSAPGNTAWENAAIHMHGDTNRYIYNNIIQNVSHGINLSTDNGSTEIYNNIIKDITSANGRHIWIEFGTLSTKLDNNLVHQAGGEEVIRWQKNNYNLTEFQSAKNVCNHCTNLTPAIATNIIDKGASLDNISQLFYETFGVPLDKDFEGNARVQGSTIDIGAFESNQ